ncbi:TcaA second domain-containing protein [Ectobacillus ponti]|uniref:TcaA second domain-containing protein n=1 Tax=Ectobacillus ponti TaxID=2961894 RepID=A0AA41XFA2_9BACI|nr:hypothetical protein [Ectobacillus ponti]MCP8971041.1 hypothetical protein [Ectobacillus ponti]
MSFCTNCGQVKKRLEDRVCVHCGERFPADEPAPAEVAEEPKVKRRRRLMWIGIVAAIILLAGGGGYAYSWLEQEPGRFTERVIHAVETHDAKAFRELASLEKHMLTQEEAERLLTAIQEDAATEKRLVRSLQEQEQALRSHRSVRPFLLKLQEQKEKKWLFAPQYEVQIQPVTLTVAVPDGAAVRVNGKKETPKEGRLELSQLPGRQDIQIEGEAAQTLYVWEGQEDYQVQLPKAKQENTAPPPQPADAPAPAPSAVQVTGGFIRNAEVEPLVLKIRAEYNAINSGLASLKKENMAGGVRYVDENGMTRKKVLSRADGETEFYYWADGTVFFAFHSHGGEENRYYFYENGLIRWIAQKAVINAEEGQQNALYRERTRTYIEMAYGRQIGDVKGFFSVSPELYPAVRSYILQRTGEDVSLILRQNEGSALSCTMEHSSDPGFVFCTYNGSGKGSSMDFYVNLKTKQAISGTEFLGRKE